MARIKLSLLAAAFVAACLTAVPSASAAVSCTYDGGSLPKRMVVMLTEPGDAAVLNLDSSGIFLQVNNGLCVSGYGFATNTNVDRIVVHDTSGGGTFVHVADPNAFAPGATLEGPLATSQIEFELDMGAGGDNFFLHGTPASDVFTVGANGINTGAGPLDFDLEITGTGIEEITALGGDGEDRLSGQGGRGTGAPTQVEMHLNGDASTDTLEGGDGDDDLNGGADPDILEGGLGTDYLDGGESGSDTVSYEHASAGVRVSLDTPESSQQTGAAGTDHFVGLDRVVGSSHDDDLRTSLLKGWVRGGAGDDRLTGSATGEKLEGGEGDDLIDPGPETATQDAVLGGPGFDTVTYAQAPKAVHVYLPGGNAGPRDGIGIVDTLDGVEAIAGSPFGDLIEADDGPNAIDGLGGGDEVYARGAADLVRARDGEADNVDCGDGDDTAVADAPTLDSLVSCEAADALPDPASGGDSQQPTAADTSLKLSVSARRGQRLLGRRAVLATIHCAGEPCRVRVGGRLGGIRLKSVTRSVDGDTRTRVKVPLSRKAIRRIRDALAHGRRPRLTLSVRGTDAAGNTVTLTRSITTRRP